MPPTPGPYATIPRGEAQSAELGDEPLAMLALDLDDALLDAAARAAKLLQPRRELGELRLIERQSADHRDRLATAAGNLTADHHARGARPRARRAVLRGTRRLPGARRSLQHHATKGLPRPHG